MPILLLEIDAWTGSAVETLRYATHTFATKPADMPANTQYDGRLLEAGYFDQSIYEGKGTFGAPATSVGGLLLNNGDGALDDLFGYGLDGRAFRLKSIPAIGSLVTTATLLIAGVLDGIESSDPFKQIQLRIRDTLSVLNKPLLTDRYAGTSTSTGLGIEGDSDLKDRIKPRAFGAPAEAPVLMVNKADLLVQVSAAGLALLTLDDGGLPMTPLGNFASIAALLAIPTSTLLPGTYATCRMLGAARLGGGGFGGTPASVLTATVQEGSSLAQRSAARVARRMLDLVDLTGWTIDEASFDALHAAYPYEVGVVVSDERTALEAVGDVLGSVGAALVASATGDLSVAIIDEPAAVADATMTLRDITADSSIALAKGPSDEGDGVPAYGFVARYGKVWQTLEDSAIFGAVSVSRREYLKTEWRSAGPADDLTILEAHRNAQVLSVDTMLTTQSDALAYATRRLNLHKVRRDYAVVDVAMDSGPLDDIGLGATVEIVIDRFGWGSGKNFLVVGRVMDFTKRRIKLRLWG